MKSSWTYTGRFFTNQYENSIWYIEENPCGCCPHSALVEYKAPITGKKTVSFTTYTPVKEFIKLRKLKELK